ncbi:hypothetical protein AB0G82_32690 [Streptomyces anulatus]|uniref:hypothetical protein n=1 Tax=Streptomyces anulatus TaxID=1892 RepID=UPI0034030F39
MAAAAAAGKTLGRPSALYETQAAAVVTAFGEKGTAVKELARQYGVGSKTIRRALDYTRARKVPEDLDAVVEEEATAPGEPPGGGRVQEADPVVMVDVPGLVAEHLSTSPTSRSARRSTAGRRSAGGRATRCGSPPRSASTWRWSSTPLPR